MLSPTLDLIFFQDMLIEVCEDVGDFSNDEDLTSSKIAFYEGVCSEEIFEGEMVSFNKEWDSSRNESYPTKHMTSCSIAVYVVVCKVRIMDLDDIMSKLESTHNFCSFVNGDGDNDVTELYENDDDDQHDVRVEDEEEVDSELQNEDDGDYDEFWIPGLSKEECISIDSMVDIRQFDMKEISDEVVCRLDFGDLELAYQLYCWKMSASDIMQVENYRKVGIRPPHMYAAFANQCGGYEKVGFIRKDIYNEEGRMRKQHSSDARGALKYLYDLRKKEPMIQLLYEVFGDVLAFDATYKKNKYLCPFVVFSGVNHHNQTIVFVDAIVTDETKETYVWLLEQLLVAMKGKAPCSIITDGDLAMRNAITRVMPGVFHRLCAWHLLRNALSHVRDKHVLKWLKKLMLDDFEVVEFEEKWKEMVATFELEDNSWIAELYEKRMKWSTAHLRGHFFAGIRTTSHCEAFHAHVAKYVHSRTNLTDFVEQFQRCLTYFRYKVVVADYLSTCEKEVLQTNLRSLERSGDELFTKEMFKLFQYYLCKTIKLRVVDCKEMVTFSVYIVVKYCSGSVWRVSYCPSTVDFTCSCMRMQSIGLPCDHILAVLVSLNFMELPSSLVLNRWSKLATEQMKDKYPVSAMYWDSQLMARSEWMNVADKGESKSVGNVVELATTSVLAPTVLEMEMVMMTICIFLMLDKMQQPQTQSFVAGSSRVGP
ncbi:hypothetical protein JHK84_040573 [Glycine max]|nr:hypothetical protein JHK84_040573 [Glycine max]